MKTIFNSKTGHRYELIRTPEETKGELLEMRAFYPPNSSEPPAHFHPLQTEVFKILSGELTVRKEGKVKKYKAGEGFTVPPNMVHSMWNDTGEETAVQWNISPALNSVQFFETLANLANAGKTNERGKPSLLQAAMMMQYFSPEMQLAKPPRWVQKPVFGLLASIAGLLGYRPVILADELVEINMPHHPPKAFSWPELLLLVAIPTLLNFIACRFAIPFLQGYQIMPIEVAYFLSVGLLALVPMFFGAIFLSGREIGSFKFRDILTRMRIKKIAGKDWLWTIGGFIGLSIASFLLAKILLPALGMNSMPFFFENMPLQPYHYWILAVWPLYFFFNIMGEELFWRGYILPRQTLLNGHWTWLIQGILWACWHLPMGLDLVLTSLPILLILPAIIQVRKNTSISIVIHAIFGGFGFLALALGLAH
ncbi:MAG: cupin domain-containing protein [Bacteroidetes bacterium]|nr:cupin domain-containing protein [Bacteroidota bacterium]